jgi:hypothetical protein
MGALAKFTNVESATLATSWLLRQMIRRERLNPSSYCKNAAITSPSSFTYWMAFDEVWEGAYLVVALGEHGNMKTNQVRFDYIIYTIDRHTLLISLTNIRRYQNLGRM